MVYRAVNMSPFLPIGLEINDPYKLTAREFVARLTTTVVTQLKFLLDGTDPDQRALRAELGTFELILILAIRNGVDLRDPDLQLAVSKLRQLNVITEAHATAILTPK